MLLKKNVITIKIFVLSIFFLIGCQQKNDTKIKIDKVQVNGATDNAKKIIVRAEKLLKNITSIHAKISQTVVSDMYGKEKIFEGTIKASFQGKVGSLENIMYETKQSIKGDDLYIKGIITNNNITELLVNKGIVKKGNNAFQAYASIASSLTPAYKDINFYTILKDYTKSPYHKEYPQKQNVFVEAIKNHAGKKCYVIAAIDPEYPKDLIQRYYFGVEDGYYYGESIEVNDEDGKQITTTYFNEFSINESLPNFVLNIPKNFKAEKYINVDELEVLKPGMQAPDWTLTTNTGSEITLSKEYANNVILLDFWATWCGPCKDAMPNIEMLHNKYKNKGLKVISVLSGDIGHENQASEYLKKYNYSFDMVFGTNEMSNDYRIRYLPTVILINKKGNILYFRDTPSSNEKKELEEAIITALNL